MAPYEPVELEFWGSECRECLNGTPDGMVCDLCNSDTYTVALYMLQSDRKKVDGAIIDKQVARHEAAKRALEETKP